MVHTVGGGLQRITTLVKQFSVAGGWFLRRPRCRWISWLPFAVGRPLEWNDAWPLPLALVCGCPLVTHGTDFSGIEGLVPSPAR